MSHKAPSLDTAAVLLAHVGVDLGGSRILDDVSFRVMPQEVVGLVGPSGCGKTTILHVVAGLRRASRGMVHVLGVDLGSASDRTVSRLRARHIGIVFQRFHLLPRESALDNVLMPAFFGDTPARKARERAYALLERVGLGPWARTPAVDLSEGQRQRVAIARALLNDPALVLADEPTGNLDDASARTTLSLLVDAVRERGGTLLLSTHDHRCLGLVDRTLQVADGTVA